METKQTEVVPVVGMGCTILSYSDRHPATVTQILSKSRFVIQEDNYKRIDDNGMSDCQTYEYTPNPEASKQVVMKTKKGWKILKDRYIHLGHRNRYYDFSF